MRDLEQRMAMARGWLRADEIRWMAIFSPIFCFAAALLTVGSDRLLWAAGGVFLSAIVLPVLTRGNPRAHGLAKFFRFSVSLALCLAGLAGCAASVWLFAAGSYGILAALVLAPFALTATYLGFVMLFTPSVPTSD